MRRDNQRDGATGECGTSWENTGTNKRYILENI